VVAHAFRIDMTPSAVVFTFKPNQKVPLQQCEGARSWLEGLAEQALGHRVPVTCAIDDAPLASPEPVPQSATVRSTEDQLRQEAMADPTVQALFEIFPVEKTKIEEM
jgi:hypothetical protein